MRANLICLAILFLACTNLNAQPVSPTARKVVQTIQKLRAMDVPHSRDLDNGPPPKVPALLKQLNQELKALIIEHLNDQTRDTLPNEEELLNELRAAGWHELPSNKWTAYGEIRKIEFQWNTDYDPPVLIVSTQLWLPCGSVDPDSAIYVFRGMSRRWELVLSTDSDFDPGGGPMKADCNSRYLPLIQEGVGF